MNFLQLFKRSQKLTFKNLLQVTFALQGSYRSISHLSPSNPEYFDQLTDIMLFCEALTPERLTILLQKYTDAELQSRLRFLIDCFSADPNSHINQWFLKFDFCQ